MPFTGLFAYVLVLTLIMLSWTFVVYSTINPTTNVWSQPWIYFCLLVTLLSNRICYWVVPGWLWYTYVVCFFVYVFCRVASFVLELSDVNKIRNTVVVSFIADVSCAYAMISMIVRAVKL